MIQHKCTQEQKITDLQKSFNDLDKRDALQAEQIAMLKEWIEKIDKKVDKIDLKIDNFIKCADVKYVNKQELEHLKEKVVSHQWIINRITWAIIMWVLSVLWWLIIAWIKFL